MHNRFVRIYIAIFGVGIIANAQAQSVQKLTLDECVGLARQNNERAAVSAADLQAARATLQQALSGYWPKLSADVKATRLDEDPLFTMPSTTFVTPPMNIQVPAMSVGVPAQNFTVPAQMIGPIPVPAQNVPVPAQTIGVPAQTFVVPSKRVVVPEQQIRVMDRDNVVAGLRATLPLYTGGLRPAYVDQARAGIDAAKEQIRRTDADLVYETTKFYYGAVLAQQLTRTAHDTLERMEATLDLTERMFNTGSGKVKKTDFLRTRSMVEVIRGSVAEAEGRKSAACAALALSIGAGWPVAVEPSAEEIPFAAPASELASVIRAAQASSPDVARAEAGLRAAEAKVREARSGYLPKVGLMGQATRIENAYSKGAVDDENVENWLVGIGAELPLFEGFKVKAKVREAHAGYEKMKHYRALAEDVVALQVQLAWIDLERSARQETSARAGFGAARENRELNVRAYQDELVETKDVIEAQLMEAFLEAQHLKVIFEHADAKARMDQIVVGE